MKKKRVCIDVGGTFTDCLVMDETGLLQKFKASTTPSDPSTGLMDAMKKAARFYKLDVKEFLGQIEVLVHGTTLATNILLTGRGAKAGMITTKGFRDSIEIRRGIKPDRCLAVQSVYSTERAVDPALAADRRRGAHALQRHILTPLNEQEVRDAITRLKQKEDIESVADLFPALLYQSDP